MTTTKETIRNITIITITNPNQEFLRYIVDDDSNTVTITGDSLNIIITDIPSTDEFLQKQLAINENSLAYSVIKDLIDYVNNYFERNDCLPNELDLLDDCEDLHEELSNLVEKNDGFISDLFDTPKLRIDKTEALRHVLNNFRNGYNELEKNT